MHSRQLQAQKEAVRRKRQSLSSASDVVRRVGLSRLVIEEDMAVVYYNTRNTRSYQEVPQQYVAFPLDDIDPLRWILQTTETFGVKDIPCAEDVDKLQIAQALFSAGVLVKETSS